MPQIANLNSSPEFPNGGFFLAGTLKTNSTGKSFLYIKGDWRAETKTQALIIFCSCRAVNNTVSSKNTIASTLTDGKTKITFQAVSIVNGANHETADELIDYFIYVNTNKATNNLPVLETDEYKQL